MNIMVIGGGGREHAICWKLSQSDTVKDLYCVPGNGGTGSIAVNTDINVREHSEVVAFCREKNIDLVVVGPEAPLAVGIADSLVSEGIAVFGPTYSGARLESSKIMAKELMGHYDIPTASFRIFDDFHKAEEYIRKQGAPLVVKAYGLAAGKGVIIAEDKEDAVRAAREMLVDRKFGAAGSKIIVEEFLSGEEASIIVLTDGKTIIPLATSQDHKRALDGDRGPNTGGMGAYSPAPVITEDLQREIMDAIIRPTVDALNRQGITYRGVLYAGIMVTDDGPRVLEYNVRFGDPEAQVILPRMKTDAAELFMAAARGKLEGMTVEWDDREHVCVVMASEGYPGDYPRGREITGIAEAEKEGAVVFHAGTKVEEGRLLTSGGRVLGVVGSGDDIKDALEKTYRAVNRIDFKGKQFRHDIGYRAVERANA
jgi:phosphoribosylamine--glycine ligase